MIVFLGDSITQWWDNGIFAKYFSSLDPLNFGMAGHTTRDTLKFLEKNNFHNLKPAVIILLIGTNNTDHDYTSVETFNEIKKITELLLELSPESKIMIISILPRGESPTDPKRVMNNEVNKLLVSDKFCSQIYFLDIANLFLKADGKISSRIMYDKLHLTPHGYMLLSEAVYGFLKIMFEPEQATRPATGEATSPNAE